MKESQYLTKVIYSNLGEASWNIKKSEFEERLTELGQLRTELLQQRKAIELLKSNKLTLQPLSNEELQMYLKISQDQLQELKKILQSERLQSKGIEKELDSCKSYIKDLEEKYRASQSQVLIKDRILSNYICEMLILKQEVEKIINPSSDICKTIKDSLSLLYKSEPIIEPPSAPTIPPPLTAPQAPNLYENLFTHLRTQLLETQELYKASNNQLKSLLDKNSQHDSDFTKLKVTIQSYQNEFSEISSQSIRRSDEKDFHYKSLVVELEELRKKRDEQDSDKRKLEAWYKNSLAEFEKDLKVSREKILQLIEDKTRMEAEILALKVEKKELVMQGQGKDLRIADFSANLMSMNQEINVLRNVAKAKGKDSAGELKSKQSERMIQELADKNSELTERISFYESERAKNVSEGKNQVKTVVQQLSNIILSRDYQGNMENNDLKVSLSRILVENRLIFEVILKDFFGDDYSVLEERMQEKVEALNGVIQELKSENESLKRQLSLIPLKPNRFNESENELRARSEFQRTPKSDRFKRLMDQETLDQSKFDRSKNHFFTPEISICDDFCKKIPSGRKESITISDFISFLHCEAAALDSFLYDSD